MASINWGKSNRAKMAGTGVHFDNAKRARLNHANKDIDRARTNENYYLGAKDYDDVRQKANDYINQIDKEHPPKKRQKEQDRTSVFSLEFVCPRQLTDAGLSDEFFKSADELLREHFGDAYVGQAVHKDETHEYLDARTKELKTSCEHGHAWVCAHAKWKDKSGNVREGINGKNFSSLQNINRLNKAFDEMCLREFGIRYNTGEEAGKKSVEQLKLDSYKTAKKETNLLQRKIVQLEQEKSDLEANNTQLQAVNEELEERVKQIHDEANKRIKQANAEVIAKKSEISDLNAKYSDLKVKYSDLMEQLRIMQTRKAKFKTEMMEFTNDCLDEFASAKTNIERNQIIQKFNQGLAEIENEYDYE